ncbi:endonuclease domain-containing protein [Methylobacterium sp. SyP6R]|uniref:endonuclease domain-containing protein n=1 Tax=Methylobacterium sp. SyP6R TaxID=2718876 RepID=UPI001F3F3925|nr:endonuclease domain-containing protein [Methylobacterium sp. SyP6R]MCF4126046.1 endonuclease domain-containing protein [Methylobacterium sp. SyP6R]
MRGPDDPGTARARTLRRAQTAAEQALWSHLRDRRLAEAKFMRQLPIGRYFADFACREAKLIVELDGSQHAESGYDRERDAWLTSQGWHVLRFWNGEVARNVTGVLETILAAIVERRPSSSSRGRQTRPEKGEARVSPLPAGGERAVFPFRGHGKRRRSRSEGEGVSTREAPPEPPPHPRPSGSLHPLNGDAALSPPAGRGENPRLFLAQDSPAASGEGHPASSRTDP